MFIVLLRFAEHRGDAAKYMEGHKAWLARGFDDGVFHVAGTLQPGQGGAIVAHGLSRDALDARVGDDPFVVHGVVRAEVLEISASRASEPFRLLLSTGGAA